MAYYLFNITKNGIRTVSTTALAVLALSILAPKGAKAEGSPTGQTNGQGRAFTTQGGSFLSRTCTKDLGGRVLIDCYAEVTQPFQFDKYTNFVNVSTPSTPSAGHSLLFANSIANQFVAVFSDGTSQVLGASTGGTITGVTAGLGLTGGGSAGTVTVGLSTPIATGSIPDYISASSVSVTYLQLSSATATYLQKSSATATYGQLNSTQTWTGGNTHTSSTTFKGAVIVSTSIITGPTLTPGTSGQILTSAGQALPTFWSSVAAGSSFSVLCSSVVALSSATLVQSYVPSHLGCSATLSNSAHHVYVTGTITMKSVVSGVSTYVALFRDTTNLDDSDVGQCRTDEIIAGLAANINMCPIIGYDAPGDTSAHVYKAYFKTDGAGTATVGNGSTARLVVIETN